MAVENQTPPAQPAAPTIVASTDFVRVISAAAALAAVIIAGMALVVSITVAPIREDMRLLREDMRLLRTDMQRGFAAADAESKAMRQDMDSEFKAIRQDMDSEFKAIRRDMNNEFKAIREDLATLNERLTRVETLLEQGAGQTLAPEEPATEVE